MISQVVSHYKILERLGGGGMGVVYKAQDLKLDRSVALKFLPPDLTRDPEAKQRFVHEAKAASALQHTNICVVHDIDETSDGQMFICMEYLEGETLKKKIERGPLKISEAIDIAIQIAQGLAKAHEHGIIHRDIKPANVMITSDGVAKIVDFGLAKLSGQTMLTKEGYTLGTAAYMSPEQTRGDLVDHRTDIWSLGVVLYEMLAGKRAFTAEYENALMYCILNAEPKALTRVRPEIPPRLQQVVAKCLAKSPQDRYEHCSDLIADLRSYADEGVNPRTSRKLQVPSGRERKGKRQLWYAFAVLGLLILALVGYLFVFPHAGVERPLPELKMIAVLPFENLGSAEDEYFADGLTDEITSRLSAVATLGVISRTSAMQYKKTKKTLPIVAKELGVDYILEGTIRWVKTASGQRIRITPQLIKASSGDVHLWADNMDRTLDDIFSVQTEIATRVVKALGLVLKEGERGLIEAIPTKNIDAYQAYLRALSYSGYERPRIILAMEMLKRAVALDSGFAEAYASLAWCHLALYFYGYDRTKEHVALARQAVDRAFAIDPELPNAYGTLGLYYYWGLRDYDKALEAFTRVEKRYPNNSRTLERIGSVWRRQGKFEEAADNLKRAIALDPKSEGTVRELGNTLLQLGFYAEAEGYLDRSIAMLPDQSRAYVLKSDLHLRWKIDTKESRRVLDQVPSQYYPCLWLTWLDFYDRNYRGALDRLATAAQVAFVEQHEITPISQLRGLAYRFIGDSTRSRASLDSARVFLE
jgi:serine/threonine protein kinase/tetratricopeptide (TPR) repeat protein